MTPQEIASEMRIYRQRLEALGITSQEVENEAKLIQGTIEYWNAISDEDGAWYLLFFDQYLTAKERAKQ